MSKKKGAQKLVTPTSSKNLPNQQVKHIQSITGLFLCYARALDYTMFTFLNDIGTNQAKPTEDTLNESRQLIDYAGTSFESNCSLLFK